MAKLLLVEDEDFLRELYKRQFEKAGFIMDAFANGKEGLNAALQNTYDLLLLDIMLPDINGIEILKQVKQNPKAASLPVVLLTNLGQDSVIKEGFKFGATGYLIKAAYTPDQVVREVTEILNQQKAVPAVSPVVNPVPLPSLPGSPVSTPATSPVPSSSPMPPSISEPPKQR